MDEPISITTTFPPDVQVIEPTSHSDTVQAEAPNVVIEHYRVDIVTDPESRRPIIMISPVAVEDTMEPGASSHRLNRVPSQRPSIMYIHKPSVASSRKPSFAPSKVATIVQTSNLCPRPFITMMKQIQTIWHGSLFIVIWDDWWSSCLCSLVRRNLRLMRRL
jgi:hypothetical protein